MALGEPVFGRPPAKGANNLFWGACPRSVQTVISSPPTSPQRTLGNPSSKTPATQRKQYMTSSNQCPWVPPPSPPIVPHTLMTGLSGGGGCESFPVTRPRVRVVHLVPGAGVGVPVLHPLRQTRPCWEKEMKNYPLELIIFFKKTNEWIIWCVISS